MLKNPTSDQDKTQSLKAMEDNSDMKVRSTSEHLLDDITSEANLKLREEQLNIYKNWKQTGEVAIHKEISTEEKTITVPIIREVLVIEKKN